MNFAGGEQVRDVRQRTLDLEGAEGNRLAGDVYDTGKQGAPVLLVHGGGQTRYSWAGTAERLARDGMSAIVIDQRGHGESDWVEGGHYRFRDYAADIVAVAEAIGRDFGAAPVAIGASLGGIASTLAQGERAQGVLRALVLVDVVPRMDPEGVGRITGFMAERMHEGFGSVDEAADAVAAYLPNRKRPRSTEGLRKNLRLHEDGRYRWHWDPRFLMGAFSVNSTALEDMRRMEEVARGLTIPLLLVRGGSSELVPEESARHFMELVPHARYCDVTGAGHMVAGDRNDIFADAAIDFIRSLGAS
ncbi:pimeloyl-ACP methyl ester carboxylesterase [Breoghania corrubedonensis]|uniref:Pimeloyl-ACP methyl ester carboxylesterase n=1 Tax=Breoghania corrubedonensis TaxID=665038 RepID=A0A2T5VD11_9HYPH|nr:alpha/beta hydrolase [Breoghania corrubedonensis]PTW61657.1 pimeloyl-ACP methyl ester carboxylesterase [Breoghania corrubedonensis]